MLGFSEIHQLCNISDVVFLKDTWLAIHELYPITELDEHFYGQGLSAMESASNVIHGRHKGGLVNVWQKTLGGCTTIDMNDS